MHYVPCFNSSKCLSELSVNSSPHEQIVNQTSLLEIMSLFTSKQVIAILLDICQEKVRSIARMSIQNELTCQKYMKFMTKDD